MERYGFTMSSISTYSAVRRESSRVGSVKKPSAASDPHANNNSESYSKPKITSPITGKCYSHDDIDVEDDYKKPEAYPMKGSDEQHNRPKSPVPGSSPRKAVNEASRPQRSSPLAATDLRHSSQPKPYGRGSSYGVYNSSYDAPIGYDDATGNGSGRYGNNNKEEGNSTISPVRIGKYDGYDDAKKGYGYKPSRSPFQSNGGGEYDDYGGSNKDYGGYDDANRGYGYKPSRSPFQSNGGGKYDDNGGPNKDYGGFGDYNNNNKERYKPTSNLVQNNNYGSRLRPAESYGGVMDPNKHKIGTSWTSSPRKGVQLSQPTNDIDKVMELMKEAAINDYSNRGGQKTTDTAALPYDDEYQNYSRNHNDGVDDRLAPRNSNWAASLGNDSRPGEQRGRFENGGVIGSPRSQISVPRPGMMTNKNDYGETIERKDGASWNNGNFGLSSRPQTPVTHVIDGREANYRTRATGPTVIDSRFVEKIGGTRI